MSHINGARIAVALTVAFTVVCSIYNEYQQHIDLQKSTNEEVDEKISSRNDDSEEIRSYVPENK